MSKDLKERFSKFEAVPPKNLWDRVAAELEQDAGFPQKLYNYQQAPAAGNWAKIAAALAQAPAPVVPLFTRYKRPLLWLTAACVVAAIVLVALLIPSSEEGINQPPQIVESIPPTQPPSQVEKDSAPAESFDFKTITARAATPQKNIASVAMATLKKPAMRDIESRMEMGDITGNFIPASANEEVVTDLRSFDDYIVYSNSNGMAMKLPKRLFSLVHCVEGDKTCDERMYRLQKTLSTNVIPNDFMGLLDILNQIQ